MSVHLKMLAFGIEFFKLDLFVIVLVLLDATPDVLLVLPHLHLLLCAVVYRLAHLIQHLLHLVFAVFLLFLS
jgi:hypothetical protein